MDLGDPTTFAAAYDAHVAGVRASAHDVLRDPHAAEDVAQEVFSALWRRPERFDPARGDLGQFLRVMARSRALDALRTKQAKQRAVDRLAAQAPPAHDHGADEALRSAERAELRGKVRRSLAALPAPQREAIALTFYADLDSNELAARVDTPLGTAKSRVRLALRKLGRDPDLLFLAPPAPRPAPAPPARRSQDVAGVDLMCLAALGLRRPDTLAA